MWARRATVPLLLLLPLACRLQEEDGMFTSTTDLQGLLDTESELVNKLNQYLEEETVRIEKLKKLVKHYQTMRDEAEAAGESFVGNPLNSFLLIKKLTSDWKEVRSLIQASSGDHLVGNLTEQRQQFGLRWPSDEDLNGAATGLMRLQDTYRLDTNSLARGVLNGKYYGPALSAQDCFELGRQTYNNGDYFHTNIWMEQAMRLYHEEAEKTISRSDILEYLAFSAYMTGNIRRALKLTNEMLDLEPEHPRGWGNQRYYEQTLKQKGASYIQRGEDGLGDADETVNLLKERQKREEELGEERVSYEQLCRGEEFITVAERSKMLCRYSTGRHPFLLIGPVKEEEVYFEPRIVLYHDIISDKELDTIKELATPRFKRATVQNYKTGELETANYRVSKTAWLKEYEHEHVGNVYSRTHQITGLNMETSEELQVSNYGIGGHYEPHFDFARKEEKNAFASLGTGE
jgi:prolyl 4-hydroxylase